MGRARLRRLPHLLLGGGELCPQPRHLFMAAHQLITERGVALHAAPPTPEKRSALELVFSLGHSLLLRGGVC